MNTELLLTLFYLTEGTPKIVDRCVARWPKSSAGTGDMVETIAAAFEAEGRRFTTRRDIANAYRQSLQSLKLAARSGITVIHRWQQRYPKQLHV
jgi:hypothetical protein